MKFPSKAHALGYQSLGTGFDRKANPLHDKDTRMNVLDKDRVVLFMSPTLKNKLINSTTNTYHNAYFDITKYDIVELDEATLKTPDGDDVILAMDKGAFKGYFRIDRMESQRWAKNLTEQFFHHYWLVF